MFNMPQGLPGQAPEQRAPQNGNGQQWQGGMSPIMRAALSGQRPGPQQLLGMLTQMNPGYAAQSPAQVQAQGQGGWRPPNFLRPGGGQPMVATRPEMNMLRFK